MGCSQVCGEVLLDIALAAVINAGSAVLVLPVLASDVLKQDVELAIRGAGAGISSYASKEIAPFLLFLI